MHLVSSPYVGHNQSMKTPYAYARRPHFTSTPMYQTIRGCNQDQGLVLKTDLPHSFFVFEYYTRSQQLSPKVVFNACLFITRKVEKEVSFNESLGLFMEESDILILVSIKVAEPKCVTEAYFLGTCIFIYQLLI